MYSNLQPIIIKASSANGGDVSYQEEETECRSAQRSGVDAATKEGAVGVGEQETQSNDGSLLPFSPFSVLQASAAARVYGATDLLSFFSSNYFSG
ncbi:hypothetical protein PIB30_027244 [Stylosanthes scabra]|uniref:Uncharacterized protein n=1 Tax=Stylosanthes scabra TaxID=79078 RepID=A0ABU6VA35_9FABA|nr:hypothetical protein [Stylosanthes scabra]